MRRIVFPAFLILTFLSFVGIQSFVPVSQVENNEQQLIAKANQFNLQYPQEKVYLHIDRPSYWSNEDIWFKAYLKNSPINTCNLYVELLNAGGKVVYRNICWVQNSLAYGSIHLADTLSGGNYQVRAYTTWMRNFDEECFFRKDLVIWNLRDKAKTPGNEALKSKDIDFQFLPEGGTFLAGVKNRLAFKVIDPNGKALDAEGFVVDEKGTQVATIKSLYKGMGSFEITPQAGMKYKAEVTIARDLSLKIDLPTATTSGVAMNINREDTSRIRLEISEQGITAAGKYIVIGQIGGNVCYRSEVPVSSGKGILDINKAKFPTGIVRLTLFDSNLLPRCERLVFVNRHDQVVVKIEPESTEYQPRENVILDISALRKGVFPAEANLSLSVYNTETTLETEEYPENILTRFLLSSELKGTVEEPAYYFKDDSLSTIFSLDNLMLTHGYRTFQWKAIRDDKYPDIVYQPDSSIQLGGKVTSIGIHKPVKDGKVTLMTENTLLAVHEQKTDSAGNFLFTGMYFADTIDVSLQAVNSRGKKNTFVEVDEKLNAPPKAKILPLIYQYKKKEDYSTVTFLSEPGPEMLNRKWHLSDTILIGDINVMAIKRKKDDGHIRPYLEADHVFEVAKSDDTFGNINDMLEANSAVYRSYMSKKAQFFLDGIPVDADLVLSQSAMAYDKIEFVKMAPVKGGIGAGIYFYSKRGFKNVVVEEPSGVTNTRLVGYSVIRNFYSPVYDGSEDKQKTKNDFRTTLYWNPVVRTNAKGLARVSFYNSNQTGEVQVVVEGVTKDGKLCRGVCKYNVIPK